MTTDYNSLHDLFISGEVAFIQDGPVRIYVAGYDVDEHMVHTYAERPGEFMKYSLEALYNAKCKYYKVTELSVKDDRVIN